MTSPYPWYYTLRWPFYFHWPSMRNHTHMPITPLQKNFLSVEQKTISILCCGDIMVRHGDKVPILHADLSALINRSDLLIGNCEAPVGTHSSNNKKHYHFRFHMPLDYLKQIIQQTELPYNRWCLSIANNHSGDAGHHAFFESRDILQNLGIQTIGLYQKSKSPLTIIECQNLRLGLVAWTHWMNQEVFTQKHLGVWRDYQIEDYSFMAIKKQFQLDFLFALPHWDYEFQHFPHANTRNLAGELIQQGFDCIVGAHPHTLQPLEIFDNGLCQYSLGNFIGLGVAWSVKLVCLLELKLSTDAINKGQIVSYQLHPFVQYHHQQNETSLIPLHLAPIQQQKKLASRLSRIFRY